MVSEVCEKVEYPEQCAHFKQFLNESFVTKDAVLRYYLFMRGYVE